MAMTAGGKGGIKADINVTPLVDVVLVLLIIFMVVTPMLQRGKDVKLPEAAKQKNDGGARTPDPLILSVTADKQIYAREGPVRPTTSSRRRSAASWPPSPGKPILLKGDQSLTFGDVRR